MNKQELIKQLAAHAEVTNRQATVMVDSLINIVMESVAKGEQVKLTGFGIFESRVRQARKRRNPQTGELIDVPETVVPVFKAGQEFKEMVRR